MESSKRLAYSEQGRGAPLVLLHAFPLSRAMWQETLERVAPFARAIAPDLPGFGLSLRQPKPLIRSMAAAVLELLDELGLREPVILAGLSMGGYVAFEVVRQAPARVKALGLFSTRAAPDSPEQRAARMALVERIRREGFPPSMPVLLPRLLGETTRASRPAAVERVMQLMRMAHPDGVIDALLAMANRADSTMLLASIPCPTLVVSGAEDTVIPLADATAMAQHLPAAELEIIPEAGHLVNLEQPGLFHAALERWLHRVAESAEKASPAR